MDGPGCTTKYKDHEENTVIASADVNVTIFYETLMSHNPNVNVKIY